MMGVNGRWSRSGGGMAAVFALVLAGCTDAPEAAVPDRAAVSVEVSAGEEAVLEADGLVVRVPEGAVDGSGDLVATPLAEAPPASEGLLATPGWDIVLDGATLTGQVEIEVPIGTGDGGVTAAVSYFDQDQQQWVPVESVVDEAGGVVTATVDHLSWWAPWTWDTNWLKEQAEAAVGQLSLPPRTKQPQCPGEDELRDAGADVASDDGSRVRWCAGVLDGEQVMKVTNAAGYVAEVRHPGWTVVGVEPRSATLEAVTASFAEWSAVDADVTALNAGQTLTLSAPVGTSAVLDVTPSGQALLMTGMLLAADILARTAKAVTWDMGDAVIAAFGSVQCADAITGLLRSDPDLTPGNVLDVVTDASTYTFDCVDQFLRQGGQWLLKAFASVVLFFASAVRTLLVGIQMLVDGTQDLNGYQITTKYETSAGAPVDVSFEAYGHVYTGFWTEDENVACLLTDLAETSDVTCTIMDFDYEVPAEVLDANRPCGNGVSLEVMEGAAHGEPEFGMVTWACIGDELVPLSFSPRLAVGQVARMDEIQCTVLDDGVRCDHDPGLSFELTRSHVEIVSLPE